MSSFFLRSSKMIKLTKLNQETKKIVNVNNTNSKEYNIIDDLEINCVDKVNYWFNKNQLAQPHCTNDNIINTATEFEPALKSTVSNDQLAQPHCTNDKIINTATEFVPVLNSSVSNNLIEISATSGSSSSVFDDTDKDVDWVLPRQSSPSLIPPSDEDINICDQKYFYDGNNIASQNIESENNSASCCIQNNIELCESNSGKDKIITRKKVKNVDEWKRNVRKIKKNSGQAYITSTGRSFDKKKLQPQCTEKCKYKCSTNFTNETREKLLESFWLMADISKQRAFVVKCTTVIIPKYKYQKEGSTRLSNSSFFLPIDDVKKRVCKKFFMATLNIGDRFVRTALLKGGRTTNFVEGDLRGKHGNKKKLAPEIINQICDHINSFPRIESHYLRNQTSREFIDGSLTIAEMWRLFDAKCKSNKVPSCKFSTYSYIFNTKFNIGFFIPKKDQCGLCEQFNNSNVSEKVELEQNLLLHKQQIELSRVEKNNHKELAIKNKNSFIVACYDLQSVLTTPSAKVSNFYYSRKFATYNLTVYNMGEVEANCYLWNEDQAKRGANEISTCIYKFLIEYCTHKHTIFYSDNCCGQQKNKFMIGLYLYAVIHLNIPSITHKYLIVGHTQNEGDNIHSVIEKQKSRLLRGGSIFSPQQWTTVIQSAKKTGKPFKVNELAYKDFLDFKKMSKNIGNNFNKNTNGQKVTWNEIKIIKVSKDLPDRIQYKTSYSQNDFLEIIVSRKTRTSKQKSIELELSPLYQQPPGVSKEKKRDLVNLCDAKFIPDSYHSFFKQLNIITDTLTTADDEDSH